MGGMTKGKRRKLLVLGAATSPHVLARARVFVQLGWQVTMLSPVAANTQHDDITIISTARGAGPLGKIRSLLACAKFLLKLQADIIHAHYAAEYGTWLAAILGRRPLVITVMGGDILFDEQGNLGPTGRCLTRFALRQANYVTAKSRRLATTLEAMGVSPKRTEVIYWGVEPELFYPSHENGADRRAIWGVPAERRILYCPRMLQPLYHQHLLISAMPAILSVFPDIHLVLSGFGRDDAYASIINSQINTLDLQDRVTITEGLDRTKMASAYNAADLVVSIPSSDGMPQSVLEAMACQKPLVISELDHYRELFIDGETAAFVALDAEAISDRIIDLLRYPDKAGKMAKAGAMLVAETANFPDQASLVANRFEQLLTGEQI